MERKWSHNAAPHRKLKMAAHFDNPQKGDDVRELQKACNARIRNLKLPIKPLKPDGESGRQTVAVARRVAHHLGVGLKTDGVSVYVQQKIRRPETRTKAQVARGQAYREEHIQPAVKIDGNTVTGGAGNRDRVVAVAMAAAHAYYTGKRPARYSQVGAWTVSYPVTGEPGQFRTDCSQWVTSDYHSAGAPDPNGQNYTGGYTGTLVAYCQEIRRDQLEPGDLIIYGTGTGHHVEMWVGNGDGKTSYAELDKTGSTVRDRTVGHGSPPVDYGDIDMISGARFFRCPGL